MFIDRPSVFAGLGSDSVKIPASTGAGVYKVSVRSTEIPPSGLVITIAQSGSQSVSVNSGTNSPVQNNTNIEHLFNCAVGDVLTVTFSSSNSVDTVVSQIKSVIAVKQGA